MYIIKLTFPKKQDLVNIRKLANVLAVVKTCYLLMFSPFIAPIPTANTDMSLTFGPSVLPLAKRNPSFQCCKAAQPVSSWLFPVFS